VYLFYEFRVDGMQHKWRPDMLKKYLYWFQNFYCTTLIIKDVPWNNDHKLDKDMNISIGAGNGTHDAESFYKRVIAGADPGFQAKGGGGGGAHL
jgi:uncharacterized protein YutD